MRLAAARDQLSAVLFLDECGADSSHPAAAPLLTLCDRRGSTVLHYAVAHDSLDVLVWAATRQPTPPPPKRTSTRAASPPTPAHRLSSSVSMVSRTPFRSGRPDVLQQLSSAR